ncbi:MAG: hypothetical protein CSA51_00200 [Gammaproteobacteria bacterium]|nr:MAG: hypothetical protein CSA51_00200 [Gammaproteobacteria bacterium]
MKKSVFTTAALTATLLLGACSSDDQHAGHSAVTLQHCTIQETIPGAKATGAFLTISKSGDAPLALVAAQAPTITNHVEIHEMVMGDGTMRMQKIPEYPLAAGDNVFKKGSYHIMLMSLEKTLSPGETYPLTLIFSDGNKHSCAAVVKTVQELTPKNMKMQMKKAHAPGSTTPGQ